MKRALITGATSGIGREFAEQLARRGCHLVLTGRREALLEEITRGLESRHGVKVRVIAGALPSSDVEQSLVQSILESPPDFLVNNAGSGFSSDFADAELSAIEDLRDLLSGLPGRLIRAALPGMTDAGGGTIINVGSLGGRVAVPGSSVYVAAKIYLERLSESLALELAPRGIVVQALTPGYVRTDFHRDVPDFRAKQRSRGAIRWLEPEAVVRASLAAADRAQARLGRTRDAGSEGRPVASPVATRTAMPRARDVVVIPGGMNRVLSVISRFVPRTAIYRAAMNRNRLE